MADSIICPKCSSPYVYEDQSLYVCPECAYEYSKDAEAESTEKIYKDAHGTQLFDGDDVIVIKDLKVRGASNPIKQGTKVKNIKLKDEDHDIDCKVDGFGQMELKTEFVKKA